ncbi:hypothetical protein C6Q09_07450 [Burkholderia multivorans]|nr:hypothetical protein C6Q09_07450 [Burkholderia multivorans]
MRGDTEAVCLHTSQRRSALPCASIAGFGTSARVLPCTAAALSTTGYGAVARLRAVCSACVP